MNVEDNINEVYHLIDKVLKMNMSVIISEVNLIKNLSNNGFTLVQQDMYTSIKLYYLIIKR